MATGIALAIGLNSVDPNHYQGWSGELNACEADAEDMGGIAISRGFQVKTLLTQEATREKVVREISDAAANLRKDDIFMLSYSGHGGQLPDLNNDEDDGQDETWCLYDGQMVDDEIYYELGKFESGVRVLVLSDSCHSGTVTKSIHFKGIGTPENVRYRFMPHEMALRVYRKNRFFYDPILQDRKFSDRAERLAKIQASVLLISGCQDNQLSDDGSFNGLFTGNLLRVWNNGTFEGNYWKLCKSIVQCMPPDQTPNYFRTGKQDLIFETQQAFTV